ncbi:MAG: MOSC domain-containing protein [Chloroflexi bacterium]|nr:MOSC domain-containing protein [Chloroflexota bacterium]MCC6895424.1 MOSC domain-containing protein [Anaerolineae bacterium]
MPQILSLQVGLPAERTYDDTSDHEGRVWRSGIFKTPVTGAVFLGRENFAGDGQADLKNHGGAHKAALMYAAAHYNYWRRVLPEHHWLYGGFGENLTVSHMTEDNVAIGDVYAVGTAQVEVSQPRQPCWKLARRWGQRDLAARVQQNGFAGWYVRVLEEGMVEAGQTLQLLERPNPEWTISRVFDILYNVDRDPAETRELAELESFASPKLRNWMLERV